MRVLSDEEVRIRRKSRAMTLAELIIGLALFAIAIIPIFGIIPTAYMSIKKAEDYASASCYAQEVLEMYRMSNPSLTDEQHYHGSRDVILNNTEYKMYIDVYGMDENTPYETIDVVVNLYWKKIPEHLDVFTRIVY